MLDAAGRVLSRWLGPYQALALLLVIGGGMTLGLALLGAEVYEDVVDEEGVAGLDQPLLDWAKRLRSPGVDAAITAFTNIGGAIGMPVLALSLAVWMAIAGRNWRPVILVVAAGAGSLLATVLGKKIFGRTRPDTVDAVPPFESSPSFPSGHTLNATVIIGVLVYLLCLQLDRLALRVGVIFAGTIFVVAMGLSRVFLGHHWFTDVLAAWLLGLSWLGMVILAHRLFHAVWKRKRERLAGGGQAIRGW